MHAVGWVGGVRTPPRVQTATGHQLPLPLTGKGFPRSVGNWRGCLTGERCAGSTGGLGLRAHGIRSIKIFRRTEIHAWGTGHIWGEYHDRNKIIKKTIMMLIFNPLHAGLFWGNMKIYSYIFLPFLNTGICSQYHSCWWPGDERSQDISGHTALAYFSRNIHILHQKGDQPNAITRSSNNPFIVTLLYEIHT